MTTSSRRALALLSGIVCHGSFFAAVASVALGLSNGMQSGLGRLEGAPAVLANTLLALQFPILHSAFLSKRGLALLEKLGTKRHGRTLVTTSYATFAAWQLGATFLLWSPSGELWFRPHGALLVAHAALFGASWLFLMKALHDGDLRLQTGSLGWTSLWRGTPPRYRRFSEHGLFAVCRQPIYVGFFLVICTGPVWTPDHLLLALVWSTYCVLGPRLKERRFRERYGPEFDAYRARVPYFVPRLRLQPAKSRSA